MTDDGSTTHGRMRLVRPEGGAEAEGGTGDSGDVDALVLRRIRELLPSTGGMLPAKPRLVRVLWQEEDYPGDAELTAALWRLVARGALQPCLRGELLHITTPELWSEGRVGQGESVGLDANEVCQRGAPDAPASPAARRPRSTQTAAPADGIDDKELFDLQVGLDVEVERNLLYRVAVVLEVIYGLVLVREAVLAWLGH